MDAVALAATIGGTVIALAGVGATAWGAKQQRESAKELEASRQTHERRLASGERFYKKRSAIYEDLVSLTRRWLPELLADAPLMNIVADRQQLPEPPSIDEQKAFMEKLVLFGSMEVGEAYDEFKNSLDEYHAKKFMLSTPGEIPVPDEEWNQLEVLRRKAVADLAKVERLANTELESL